MLNSALPPQRHRPDTQLEQQDPVSHMAQKKMEKIQETFNKDLEELKSKQTMMNNTINKTKNSLEGIKSRMTEA